MILPGSPILYLIVVVGVIVYYACKGVSCKASTKQHSEKEKWSDEVKRREEYVKEALEKNPDAVNCKHDYLMWLYTHQQG